MSIEYKILVKFDSQVHLGVNVTALKALFGRKCVTKIGPAADTVQERDVIRRAVPPLM